MLSASTTLLPEGASPMPHPPALKPRFSRRSRHSRLGAALAMRNGRLRGTPTGGQTGGGTGAETEAKTGVETGAEFPILCTLCR